MNNEKCARQRSDRHTNVAAITTSLSQVFAIAKRTEASREALRIFNVDGRIELSHRIEHRLASKLVDTKHDNASSMQHRHTSASCHRITFAHQKCVDNIWKEESAMFDSDSDSVDSLSTIDIDERAAFTDASSTMVSSAFSVSFDRETSNEFSSYDENNCSQFDAVEIDDDRFSDMIDDVLSMSISPTIDDDERIFSD